MFQPFFGWHGSDSYRTVAGLVPLVIKGSKRIVLFEDFWLTFRRYAASATRSSYNSRI